ncbi:MAG: serine/threonine-protein kinase [Verrucomicrobiota bacterium]
MSDSTKHYSHLTGLDVGKLAEVGLEATAADSQAPEIPGYKIHRQIGRGGMGVAWLATQESLGRKVAIKVLPPNSSAEANLLERLEREARIMGQLDHSGIVAVHDFVRLDDESAAIVMQLVEGGTLRQLLNRREKIGLSLAEFRRYASVIVEALLKAHEAGVVHRDLKPENVLITKDGDVKVGDFGLAAPSNRDEATLTGTDVTMGTANYMAPEQFDSSTVDHRADIYSLGVMLYEMLHGSIPRGAFRPLCELHPDIPEKLSLAIQHALQPEPDDRPDSVVTLAAAINAAQSTAAPPRRSILPWILVPAVVAAGFVGYSLINQNPKENEATTEQDEWTDLLSPVDLNDPDNIHGGPWRRDGNAVVSDGESIAHLILERSDPGSSYDVRFRAERLSGEHGVSLHFSSDAGFGSADFDGWDGDICGVHLLDGLGTEDPERSSETFVQTLEVGVEYEFLIQVRPNEIHIHIDGERRLTTSMVGRKLSPHSVWEWWHEGEDKFVLHRRRPVYIALGTWKSSIRFSDVQMASREDESL